MKVNKGSWHFQLLLNEYSPAGYGLVCSIEAGNSISSYCYWVAVVANLLSLLLVGWFVFLIAFIIGVVFIYDTVQWIIYSQSLKIEDIPPGLVALVALAMSIGFAFFWVYISEHFLKASANVRAWCLLIRK